MIKLDDNLLTELGLQSLPAEDKKALLRHIYETLEMRVGTTLARQMTDAQLDEFESFINNNDEAGALRWLETNFPNYKDVVAQEFEVLKAEVRQSAPQILASAGSQAQATPMQALQPQMAAPQPVDQYQAYQQPQMVPQQPQQQAQPQSYEVAQPQQPVYGAMPAQQPQAPQQPAYSTSVQQPMATQPDYQQYQQPQPMQQFDPATQAPQAYAPQQQYPQPVAPAPYQQPQQQAQPQSYEVAQPQQPQQSQPQPFDQGQFGQAA